MSDVEEVGIIDEKKYEEAEIEWKIQDFSSVAENKTVIYGRIFTFANTQWRLQLSLKPSFRRMRISRSKKAKASYVRLYLRRIEICGEICSVECDFGLKKMDGSIEQLCLKIFLVHGNQGRTAPCYIRMEKIMRHKSEMVPSDTLVITCKLTSTDTSTDVEYRRRQRETDVQLTSTDVDILSNQPRMLDVLKLNTIIKTDLLSENLKDLFTNKDNCDTVLVVKDKEFEVHKAILIARSPIFAAMFRHDTAEKQTGKVFIKDCDPDSFQVFLEYLYTGKLDGISSSSVFNLYKISDKYNVHELKIFCTHYLMLNLTVQNVCEVFTFADQYNEKSLLSTAQQFFNDNFKEILVTTGWKYLVRKNFAFSRKILIQMENDREEMLEIPCECHP